VDVNDYLGGRQGGAPILFVCPDNKSDSDAALGFAVRTAALMNAGVGVVVVDIAPGGPSWAAHLHSLAAVFPAAKRPRTAGGTVLLVHPTARDHGEQFGAWHHFVAPGTSLPTVSVPVRGAMYMKLDLEATYTEACERSRIP
jgi:hypothetical protein